MLIAPMRWCGPIRRLEVGAKIPQATEVNIPVSHATRPSAARDESNLQTKEELLSLSNAENDRLLLSMMPEPVVEERYRLPGAEPTGARQGVSPSTRHPQIVGKFSTAVVAPAVPCRRAGRQFGRRTPWCPNAFARCTMAIGCGVTTPRQTAIHEPWKHQRRDAAHLDR